MPPPASKELKGLFERTKVITTERKRIFDIIEELNKVITDAETKKTKAEKKVHPKYKKLNELDKGIKELERDMQVTSTDAKREKELIKEMLFIKESKPYIEEIDRLRDFIFAKKHEKYEVGKGLKEMKDEITDLKKQIDTIKKSQDQVQETKEGI